MNNKNLTILVLAVLCVVLAAGLFFSNLGPGFGKIVVKPEKAKELVLSYIDENILMGAMKSEAEGEIKEESGVYKIGVKIGGDKFPLYVTKDAKLFFLQAIELATSTAAAGGGEKEAAGNFSETEDEICLENGKPIVYFFGSKSCPHCAWEHPVMEKAAEKFGNLISFHNNMDNDADGDIFSEYSSGGIPTLVLGCRYYRVGSGENMGEEKEIEALTSLICELTGNQPAGTCELKN